MLTTPHPRQMQQHHASVDSLQGPGLTNLGLRVIFSESKKSSFIQYLLGWCLFIKNALYFMDIES